MVQTAKRKRAGASIKYILQLYGQRAAEAARQSIKDNAETLVSAAKELCPVEKGFYKGRQHTLKHPGRLRDSIHIEEGKKDTLLVVADATDDKDFCYARIIEYGPRGTPFMTPAYEAKKIEMINHSKDLIRAAIRQ